MAITPAGAPVSPATPGDEAALELLGVEGGEDIAEVVVRRRPVAKRTEPPQKRQLLAPEAGNIDEGLRPGQHREQTQQQHLVERIHHLAALARVGQIVQIPEKDGCLENRATVRCHVIHRRPPRIDSEDRYGFSIPALCHALPSPDCPVAKWLNY